MDITNFKNWGYQLMTFENSGYFFSTNEDIWRTPRMIFGRQAHPITNVVYIVILMTRIYARLLGPYFRFLTISELHLKCIFCALFQRYPGKGRYSYLIGSKAYIKALETFQVLSHGFNIVIHDFISANIYK